MNNISTKYPSCSAIKAFKVSGDTGMGEKRVYLINSAYSSEVKSFFSDSPIVVDRKELITYMEQAEYEYLHSEGKYRENISQYYEDNLKLVQRIQTDYVEISAKITEDGTRIYVQFDEKNDFYSKYVRAIALPLVTEYVFSKIQSINGGVIKLTPVFTGKVGNVEEDNNSLYSSDMKGTNELYYGVPGTGKSFAVDERVAGKQYERVVFHPEYSYADFVGQIMPKVSEDGKTIEYSFVEGPFTRILKEAYKEENKDKMLFLVIEELNRGNAPAIFGDIFQLLDRDSDGKSKYGIKNVDIARVVFGQDQSLREIKIPNNVTILATMNTSDQNVFTLDTAFQRRWNMKLVSNQFRADHDFADMHISDTSITWRTFNETINDLIVTKNAVVSTEDKRIGTYFISAQDLQVGSDIFPEKVLKYLWDDAVRFSREIVFNIKDFPTLELVIEHFEKSNNDERLKVFRSGLFGIMADKTHQNANLIINEGEEDE